MDSQKKVELYICIIGHFNYIQLTVMILFLIAPTIRAQLARATTKHGRVNIVPSDVDTVIKVSKYDMCTHKSRNHSNIE